MEILCSSDLIEEICRGASPHTIARELSEGRISKTRSRSVTPDILKLLNTALVDLEGMVEDLGPDGLRDAADMMTGVAEKATRIAAYFESRGAGGMGDSGHATALQNQNVAAGRVRKALGFTQARADIRW